MVRDARRATVDAKVALTVASAKRRGSERVVSQSCDYLF